MDIPTVKFIYMCVLSIHCGWMCTDTCPDIPAQCVPCTSLTYPRMCRMPLISYTSNLGEIPPNPLYTVLKSPTPYIKSNQINITYISCAPYYGIKATRWLEPIPCPYERATCTFIHCNNLRHIQHSTTSVAIIKFIQVTYVLSQRPTSNLCTLDSRLRPVFPLMI